MTTIYLIRHGQASAGAANYDVLSELGRDQAKRIQTHLHQCGVRFDAVYSGSMERQRDTANLASKLIGPDSVTEARLNEYNHKAIFARYLAKLSRTDPDIAALGLAADQPIVNTLPGWAFLRIMKAWSQEHECDDPEFETWPQFVERTNRAMNGIAARHSDSETIAVFSSGGVISTFIQGLFGLHAEHAFDMNCNIYNAAISRVAVVDQAFRLREFNNISHLQLNAGKDLITYI